MRKWKLFLVIVYDYEECDTAGRDSAGGGGGVGSHSSAGVAAASYNVFPFSNHLRRYFDNKKRKNV